MFRSFGAPEFLVVLLIVLVLFGGKKLPDAARGLGRSLRILKAETRGLSDSKTDEANDSPSQS
jgi:sec-independent protein translocase protein TatA